MALADSYPVAQPRPQGAFPWLWETRPGDEVAGRYLQRYLCIFWVKEDWG